MRGLAHRADHARQRMSFEADDRAGDVVAGRQGANGYRTERFVAVLARTLNGKRYCQQRRAVECLGDFEGSVHAGAGGRPIEFHVRKRERFVGELQARDERPLARETEDERTELERP